MDFKGQALADVLYRLIMWLFGVLGFVAGYLAVRACDGGAELTHSLSPWGAGPRDHSTVRVGEVWDS